MKNLAGIARSVAAAAVAMAAFSPLAAHSETVLKLANFVPVTNVFTPSVVEPFVEGVKADTNGELAIQVYNGGELGAGPAEQYVRLLTGVSDISWSVIGYTSTQFPKTMMLDLPGGFPDAGKGYEAFWRAYDDHLKAEFPNARPLAVWSAEPNIFIMRDKEVRSPEDLKGLKIRVAGSVTGTLVEALGATPVYMNSFETYNALQTGLIDGTVTGASAVKEYKWEEVAKVFVTGPQLGGVSFWMAISDKSYNALSPDQQKAIDENSGIKLSASGEAGWNALAKETMERLKTRAGSTVIELSAEESAAFDEIAFAVRDKFIEQSGAQEAFAAMQGN